jgi:cellulose biosynthesis protein BcsQ
MVMTTPSMRSDGFAVPVMQYDSASKGSEAYRNLSAEILARHPLASSKVRT